MPRRAAVDPDLRPPVTPRRRFPGWTGRRSGLLPLTLPSLALPAGATGRQLVCDGTDVARARRQVGDRLGGWDVAPTDVAAVLLVVSELVSHALAHEHAGRVEVTVVDQGEHVTLVVEYARGSGRHAAAAPSPVAPGTLGLTVVGRIATRWGHAEVGPGGRFWAVVATPRAVAPSRRH